MPAHDFRNLSTAQLLRLLQAQRDHERPFDDWWIKLRRTLKPGMRVDHWSESGRYRNRDFIIIGYLPHHVCVRLDSGREVLVDQNQFRTMFKAWSEYSRGYMSRPKVDGLISQSTYVISIMRWAEQHINVPCP